MRKLRGSLIAVPRKFMDQELNQFENEKSYEPPKLTVISLRPEEAVLGHCKISGTGGPVASNCSATFCMSLGS